jgi:hypothetical protein
MRKNGHNWGGLCFYDNEKQRMHLAVAAVCTYFDSTDNCKIADAQLALNILANQFSLVNMVSTAAHFYLT